MNKITWPLNEVFQYQNHHISMINFYFKFMRIFRSFLWRLKMTLMTITFNEIYSKLFSKKIHISRLKRGHLKWCNSKIHCNCQLDLVVSLMYCIEFGPKSLFGHRISRNKKWAFLHLPIFQNNCRKFLLDIRFTQLQNTVLKVDVIHRVIHELLLLSYDLHFFFFNLCIENIASSKCRTVFK